mmetsp:Transcript_88617/g.259019  ORF Transcript_88617/g.259019 Transcript_88617/m.259019 type:complete len:254 (-) Transcript_88617:369-1130(-)
MPSTAHQHPPHLCRCSQGVARLVQRAPPGRMPLHTLLSLPDHCCLHQATSAGAAMPQQEPLRLLRPWHCCKGAALSTQLRQAVRQQWPWLRTGQYRCAGDPVRRWVDRPPRKRRPLRRLRHQDRGHRPRERHLPSRLDAVHLTQGAQQGAGQRASLQQGSRVRLAQSSWCCRPGLRTGYRGLKLSGRCPASQLRQGPSGMGALPPSRAQPRRRDLAHGGCMRPRSRSERSGSRRLRGSPAARRRLGWLPKRAR